MARYLAVAIATAALSLCALGRTARAGGFDELPDQGAQALGRGATFTAKADDATAIYYNIAGLARQRGTKVQISGNLQLNTIFFARAGRYPDSPTDPATPWGGKPFPVVENKESSFILPMMVVTSDLGIFDRLTFGLGVWAPSTAAKTFPIGIKNQPSPARYDSVTGGGIIAFPTLSAAYRLTPSIDIGVGAHLVVAQLDELAIAYYDPGGGSCKNPEYFLCDAETRLDASGTGFAASASILARPSPSFQLGAQVRSPASLTVVGTATSKLGSTELPASPASVTIEFPLVARAGARYIGLVNGDKDPTKPFELYDIELDGVFEAWGATGVGPTATSVDPATKKTTSLPIIHRWENTFSLRLGGAYNIPLSDATVSLRAGTFYDSPTTTSAYTRLDANTLAKVAGTLGVGYRTGAFALNLAYAAIGSISRSVTDGDIRTSNAAKDGQFVTGDGKPLPATNNGEYSAFSHVISFGIEVNFETFFHERKSTYGDPAYEDVAPEPKDEPEPKKKPKRKDRDKDRDATGAGARLARTHAP